MLPSLSIFKRTKAGYIAGCRHFFYILRKIYSFGGLGMDGHLWGAESIQWVAEGKWLNVFYTQMWVNHNNERVLHLVYMCFAYPDSCLLGLCVYLLSIAKWQPRVTYTPYWHVPFSNSLFVCLQVNTTIPESTLTEEAGYEENTKQNVHERTSNEDAIRDHYPFVSTLHST